MNIFEGTHIKLDLKRYPNQVFFFKEDVFWMEYNWKNGYLGCKWKDFWETLKKENNWNYEEVQAFIKDQAEQHFKLKGVTPPQYFAASKKLVEEHFKLKGVTPAITTGTGPIGVEEHFKLKGVTPFLKSILFIAEVEEHFKLKGVTPYFSQSSEGAAVEEHFKLKGIR